MKLEKAIEKLTALGDRESGSMEEEDVEALILGIEALNRCKAVRNIETAWDISLLPGETEE